MTDHELHKRVDKLERRIEGIEDELMCDRLNVWWRRWRRRLRGRPGWVIYDRQHKGSNSATPGEVAQIEGSPMVCPVCGPAATCRTCRSAPHREYKGK